MFQALLIVLYSRESKNDRLGFQGNEKPSCTPSDAAAQNQYSVEDIDKAVSVRVCRKTLARAHSPHDLKGIAWHNSAGEKAGKYRLMLSPRNHEDLAEPCHKKTRSLFKVSFPIHHISSLLNVTTDFEVSRIL